MQFVDLGAQQRRIKKTIDDNIQRVLNHCNYIMGPEIGELEQKLSKYIGVKHAIGCSSGTDALLLALMTYGVGPGNTIFTTPFTFIATAEVISILGATPVFVDIDPKTLNLDPEKLALAISALKANDPSIYPLPLPRHDTLKHEPRGIIPVDMFGLPADYDKINNIAAGNDLFVIEDAAQSFGGEYHGKKCCALGDIGCTSFFPAKTLGCYGDGGMCFTDDDEKADVMRSIVLHGKGAHKYENVRIGCNGRLDTLQAAILLAKFDIFPEEVELRNQVAQRYSDLLDPRFLLDRASLPDGARGVWAYYSILADDGQHRESIQTALKEHGIPTAIYYPKPLHIQDAFTSLGYKKGDFPVSEDCASRIFSLPMHPYLAHEDQKKIADVINECTS